MAEPQRRVYARSSAFEGLLAKVYIEIWDAQSNPSLFADKVERFVNIWLPSMFQDKIADEIPDLQSKINDLETKLTILKQASENTDPLTAESIQTGQMPIEIADLAGQVWHAVIDVLTDAGFNFPVGKETATRKMM